MGGIRTQSRAAAASGAPRGPPGRVSQAIRGYCCCYCCYYRYYRCCCRCWCCCCRAGAGATPVFQLSSSGPPGLDSRGPWQASVKSLRSEPVLPHPPSKTSYRDSEPQERKGLSRLRAVCRRAGPRGRGSSSPRDARASPRLHVLVATVTTGAASRRQRGARVRGPTRSSSPGTRCLRECEPRGLHAPSGESRPRAPRCTASRLACWAASSWVLWLSELSPAVSYKERAVSLSLLPHSVPLGHLRPRKEKELAQSQTVAQSRAVKAISGGWEENLMGQRKCLANFKCCLPLTLLCR